VDAFTVFMEHAVNVSGQVSAPDGAGGTTLSWPSVRQANVQCLINAPMLGAQDRFDADNLVGTVTIATFYSGIQRGDLLTVTAGPPYVGASLHVTGIKGQPGVEMLGFPAQEVIYHIQCEHVLVNQ
jgi:hypothetical protein